MDFLALLMQEDAEGMVDNLIQALAHESDNLENASTTITEPPFGTSPVRAQFLVNTLQKKLLNYQFIV